MMDSARAMGPGIRSLSLGIAGYIGLALLASRFAEPLAHLLLGPIGWVSAYLFPQFEIVNLDVSWVRGEMMYALEVRPTHPFLLGTKVVAMDWHPLATLSATTPAKHWFQSVLVAATLVAAWPAVPFSRRALALLVLMPLITPCVLLDAPLVLAGALDDLLRATFAPESLSESWLGVWMRAMDGGGRLALGAMAGYMAVSLTRVMKTGEGGGHETVTEREYH